MQPKFIYCYDALCGWCYGFSPVISALYAEYGATYDFEVLSGGMVPVDHLSFMQDMAPYIREEREHVEARTGVTFGEPFLNQIRLSEIKSSTWHPTSLAPAVAMVVIKDLNPQKQIPAIKLLQRMIFQQAMDMDRVDNYRVFAQEIDLDFEQFKIHFEHPNYQEKAQYEFALVKQLRVNGFPTLLLQTGDRYLYLLSRGYSDYPTVSRVLESVLLETSKKHISQN